MDLWILHPSLILSNQIFLLLNYWCNLINPIRLLYIVNSVFSISYAVICSALSVVLDYLQSVLYSIRFSFSYSFHFFSWFPLFVFSSPFSLFFLFWTIRPVSCPFPYYFASHFCFPDSLMIFLINIKINNKHNIYYGSLDPSSFPNP